MKKVTQVYANHKSVKHTGVFHSGDVSLKESFKCNVNNLGILMAICSCLKRDLMDCIVTALVSPDGSLNNAHARQCFDGFNLNVEIDPCVNEDEHLSQISVRVYLFPKTIEARDLLVKRSYIPLILDFIDQVLDSITCERDLFDITLNVQMMQ